MIRKINPKAIDKLSALGRRYEEVILVSKTGKQIAIDLKARSSVLCIKNATEIIYIEGDTRVSELLELLIQCDDTSITCDLIEEERVSEDTIPARTGSEDDEDQRYYNQYVG